MRQAVKLEVHGQEAIFSQLQPEWNALVRNSAANRIFSTLEWQSAWWAAFRPGPLQLLTCRDRTGGLLAIAPLFIDRGPDGEKVLSLVGCKEVTDYLDIIIAREHFDPVLVHIADWLAAAHARYDRIEFCNIPAASPVLASLPDLLRARGFLVEVRKEDVCPVLQLPATWGDYVASLEKKQRHELRRKLRRARGNASRLDWYTVGPEHDLDDEMTHFLALMAASDPAKKRFLDDPGNLSFFRNIAAVMLQRGWLRLNFLTIAGERAATYLNFVYNDALLVYNSGLQPESYGHLSPGIVLLAWNIRHAIESGLRVFDFLQGDESYKHQMGGRDEAVYNLYATKG